MKRVLGLLALVCVLYSGIAAEAGAEIYRWTDAKGVAHFSMDLSKVPPQYRAHAEASAGTVGKNAKITVIAEPIESPKPLPRRTLQTGIAPAAQGARAGGTDTERVGGHDQRWWEQSIQRYTREISTLERQVTACKDIKAPRRYNADTGRRMKRQHYDRKMDAVDRCSASQSTLDAKERQLANFRENARKKGVPPGWIRLP